MNRDPFFDAILEGLSKELDPTVFELCVVDLLRRDWPRIAPIVGGNDGGMDGGAGMDDGPPLPLVTTTSRANSIADNLRRNLASYVDRGGVARRAVLASSKPLSGRRRTLLVQIAASLGFQLAQTYDAHALALLLYHNSSWTKRLLGISGMASALSRIARTSRPIIGSQAIGRQSALQWLRHIRDDRVLVGQPGSGKTFLLQILANEDRALFMAAADRDRLADSIRDQSPSVIVVDDAQSDINALPLLRQMRVELEVEFAIVATTWPSGRGEIEEALGVAPSTTHELQRLTRDQIVQVVTAAGILGPNDLVREIVNQAEGRPGLAVTLSFMCLSGYGRDVVTGALLHRSLAPFFRGPQTTEFLAVAALTGDFGASLETLAHVTGLSLLATRSLALNLAHAGVLLEQHDSKLSVRPVRLRQALVKETFFGAIRLPFQEVAAQLELTAAARGAALVGALHVGAEVPLELLRGVLLDSDSGDLFRDYAWWNREAAEWCLAVAQEHFTDFVRAGLANAPEPFVAELVSRAAADTDSGRENLSLRTLREWIESASPGTSDVLQRRSLLVTSALAAFGTAAPDRIVGEALRFSIFPGFKNHETDPGRGRNVTFTFGLLPHAQLLEVSALWPRIFEGVRDAPGFPFAPLLAAVEDWLHPGRHSHFMPEDAKDYCKEVAIQMLQDLCQAASHRPGVAQRARRAAREGGISLEVVPTPADTFFEILFPPERFSASGDEEQLQAVAQLAEPMKEQGAASALAIVRFCEDEARASDISYPRHTPSLCTFLATLLNEFGDWLREGLRVGLPADCLKPFLAGMISHRESSWDSVCVRCLDDSRYTHVASLVLITTAEVPEDLLSRAIAFPWAPSWLNVAARHKMLSTAAIRRFLADNRDAIAGLVGVAVYAEQDWAHATRDTVRESVLRCPPDEFALGLLLSSDGELAFDYLHRLLTKPAQYLFFVPHSLTPAFSALAESHRSQFVRQLNPEMHGDELVQAIVGTSDGAFIELLSRSDIASLRLAPLRVEETDPTFLHRIEVALSNGVTFPEILSAATKYSRSWSGSEADMWKGHAEKLSSMRSDASPSAQMALDQMIASYEALALRARKQEDAEEIFG